MTENIDTGGMRSGGTGGQPPQPQGEMPRGGLNINREGYKGLPNKSLLKSKAVSFADMKKLAVDHDIYAINNSQEVLGKRMKVTTSIRSQDGSEILITVGDTWIPINLSEQASNDDLIASHHLRESAAKGHILFIHPDFAEELMLGDMAQAEKRRISMRHDMTGYADVLAGKEEPRPSHVFEPPPPPSHITEVQGVRPDFVGAVNNSDWIALHSAVTSAIFNEDLEAFEIAYIKQKCTHRDTLRLLESYEGSK
jgi:hypothetical protein